MKQWKLCTPDACTDKEDCDWILLQRRMRKWHTVHGGESVLFVDDINVSSTKIDADEEKNYMRNLR